MTNRTIKLFLGWFVFLAWMLPHFSFAQLINVDNPPYNAVGDGVTDDHAAIQAAIWDLRSSGGELQFTSGKTYIISEGLNFYTFPDDQDYLVTSSGEAKATIKLQDGAPLTWAHWGIRLSESNNVTIRNLQIDGNRDTRFPAQEYSGIDVFFIDGASNGTRLENLDLINSPGDNLYIVVHPGESPMTDFEMHNCRLENGYRNNMSVISGSNFKIIGCEFINANGTPPEAGIDFEPNAGSFPYSNMLVEGCLFEGNQNYGLMLTHIVGNTGFSVIKDNVFDNNGLMIASESNLVHHNIFVHQDHQHDHGNETRDGIIYFHTDVTSNDNEVYNNYFYDNNMPAGSHLINFMYNAGGNNLVHDNYAHGNTVVGFVINNTNPATTPQVITNNSFLNHREMGYWNMDAEEIVGNTIQDLSDFAHDGTNHGANTVYGVANEGLDFSPDNNYVTIPANDNLDIDMNFTVLAWINWAGQNSESSQVIIGRGVDWDLRVGSTGELKFNGGGFLTTPSVETVANTIAQNQWKLVTITYNGRELALYVDGVLQVSERVNGSLGKSLPQLYLGGLQEEANSFNGRIDDVRVYNYSFNQLEVQNSFEAVTFETTLGLKTFLQGAYDENSQLMNDDLRLIGVIPLSEPFTQLGYIHVLGGGETTTQAVMDVEGSNAIVDWIFVELHDGNLPSTVLATQSALLQRDGDIVGVDGFSMIQFEGVNASEVFVVLRHRNHFGTRAAGNLPINQVSMQDYTATSLELFSTQTMMEIGGKRVMIAGDMNSDGQINAVDKNNFWRIENGNPYNYFISKADINLDGVINAVDLNGYWRVNNSKVEQVE